MINQFIVKPIDLLIMNCLDNAFDDKQLNFNEQLRWRKCVAVNVGYTL